jgi:hypothetical protein
VGRPELADLRTAVFSFTDIQRSTRLWAADKDAM